MIEYKTCDNCIHLKDLCKNTKHAHRCFLWSPIPCPHCGGVLSEAREYAGKMRRHCYSCHFMIEEWEGEKDGVL